jgi:hypothetical protein
MSVSASHAAQQQVKVLSELPANTAPASSSTRSPAVHPRAQHPAPPLTCTLPPVLSTLRAAPKHQSAPTAQDPPTHLGALPHRADAAVAPLPRLTRTLSALPSVTTSRSLSAAPRTRAPPPTATETAGPLRVWCEALICSDHKSVLSYCKSHISIVETMKRTDQTCCDLDKRRWGELLGSGGGGARGVVVSRRWSAGEDRHLVWRRRVARGDSVARLVIRSAAARAATVRALSEWQRN